MSRIKNATGKKQRNTRRSFLGALSIGDVRRELVVYGDVDDEE